MRAVDVGKSWCRSHGARLIHANTTKAGVAAWFIGRGAGVPVVFHHRLETPGGLVARLAFRSAARVICVSSTAAAGLMIPEARRRVVYDGIDAETFGGAAALFDAGVRGAIRAGTAGGAPEAPPGGPAPVPPSHEEEVRRIAVVGRLSRDKGQDLFLHAARLVAREHAEVRFFLVGEAFLPADAAFERGLRRLAEVPELRGRVHFLGFCAEVPLLLARMDLVVAPSRRESLGIAVLEAMAARRPVVAFSQGGLCETVVHGETGFLVPPGDEQAMAAAILKLLADPARMEEMGQRGRTRVRESFSLEAMTKGVEAVYAELLEEIGR